MNAYLKKDKENFHVHDSWNRVSGVGWGERRARHTPRAKNENKPHWENITSSIMYQSEVAKVGNN